MAIVGRPDLNNYRLRLEEIQESIVSGSKSTPYQIGGTAHFPQWVNTISVIDVTREVEYMYRWTIQARFFLARGKNSDSTFEALAALTDADVVDVVSYFQTTAKPFITATYTTNPVGLIPQPINITATSPATYPIAAGVQFLGSSYELTWNHRVNYRADV